MRRSRRQASWRALGCLIALLAAGCGTTVQLDEGSQPAVSAQAGEGLSVPTLPTATKPVEQPSSRSSQVLPSSTVASVEPSRHRADSGGSPTSPPATHSASLGGASAGRGFTAKTITLGVVIPSGGSAFAAAFGLADSSGDLMAQYNAVAHYINQHGGIAGRQVVLKQHGVDIGTAVNNPSLAAQQVCAAFTQDAHVFAVLNPVPGAPQRSCLEHARTPLIDGGTLSVRAAEYSKYPDLLFGAGKMMTDLVVKLLIESLVDRNFFQGWNTLTGTPGKAPVKVGFLYPEQPDGVYQAQLQMRLIRAAGFRVADTVSYPPNVTAGLAATQGAILRFKAEGITHVVGASAFFLEGAQAQGYHPRYVIPVGAVQAYAGVVPPQQMAGSMSVGFMPAHDVDAHHDPGPVSPAQTRCASVMRNSGQSPSARDALAQMSSVCDVLFMLQSALSDAHGLSNAVLAAGVNRLGTSWQSAQTFVSDFSAHRHASAVAVRDMGFDRECSCMVYTGKGLRR
jgi:hypothetical protein